MPARLPGCAFFAAAWVGDSRRGIIAPPYAIPTVGEALLRRRMPPRRSARAFFAQECLAERRDGEKEARDATTGVVEQMRWRIRFNPTVIASKVAPLGGSAKRKNANALEILKPRVEPQNS